MAPFAARPGLPPALALVGLASVFGLSAYTIHIDKHYGPSTFTAWGIVYLTVFAKPAVVSRAFVPIAYTACVLAATATYGWETLQSF